MFNLVTKKWYDFNPRSPHGERRSLPATRTSSESYFNPRSPHGERLGKTPLHCKLFVFQPTLPARGATRLFCRDVVHHAISTHAPRTGSDADLRCGFIRHTISTHAPRTGSDHRVQLQARFLVHFNPRSPHGERPSSGHATSPRLYFNPRSPHGERPCVRLAHFCARYNFNPRSPHGERLHTSTT